METKKSIEPLYVPITIQLLDLGINSMSLLELKYIISSTCVLTNFMTYILTCICPVFNTCVYISITQYSP